MLGQTSRGSGLLLLAAAIWGFAFVAQRAGMEFVGPFLFNGVRFLLGTLVLAPLLWAQRNRATAPRSPRAGRGTTLGLVASGLVLTVAANLQQTGLVTTTAGKAGFLTGLYVVLVPLLGLLRGQRVGWPTAIAVPLSAAGLYLLSVTGSFQIAVGDAWVLCGALLWAVHVQIIDWLADRADALVIAIAQFSICGVLSLGAALLWEANSISGVLAAAGPIAYAGVLSVGVAYTLQVVGQKLVDPSRAGVVLSLEGVFAALGGWVVLGERLSPRNLAGCALMLAAMLLAQLCGAHRQDCDG